MVREQGFYTARLSDSVQVANTSMRWGGRTWAMVLTPLPADSVERGILLMHEVWHSVQARVGIPLESPDNPQLATVAGRTWLKVEGRALDAALASSGAAQRRAMGDAFAARQRRRAALPGSDSTERPLELSEGLAEYTGIVVVVAPGERARVGRARLARLEQGGSLMRSFPYATGTAWALLLDIVDPGWRKHSTPGSDLAYMAAVAMGIDTSAVAGDDARFAAYGCGDRGGETARHARAGGAAGFTPRALRERSHAPAAAGGNEHVVRPEQGGAAAGRGDGVPTVPAERPLGRAGCRLERGAGELELQRGAGGGAGAGRDERRRVAGDTQCRMGGGAGAAPRRFTVQKR